MLKNKVGLILALIFYFTLLLGIQKGFQADAEVIYPVYNVTQRVYASDLQAALDGAMPDDFIQVVARNASFIASLNWQVEGVTLDLNGAVITAPYGKNAINVTDAVYSLNLQNGTLKTSSIKDNGIEVAAAGSTDVELNLHNMVIDGGKAVYFKRNGRLEWSGGSSGGLEYGVRVDYGVKDFTGIFREVTFTRSSKGAVYFSGLRANNPVSRVELLNCHLGEDNNPLAGPALWIEAGITDINIQSSTLTAGDNGSNFVHINAGGTLSVSDSSFQCVNKTAIYTQGINSLILTRNYIKTKSGFEGPAIKIISPSTVLVEGNTLYGPGPVGITVAGGCVTLQQNQLYGFTAGIDLQKSDIMEILVTGLENIITVDGTAFTINSALEGNLNGNELNGDIALQLLSSQRVQVVNNSFQGSTSMLINGSQGITVGGNIFKYNATGISVLDSRDISISECDFSYSGGDTAGRDITGLLINTSTGVNVNKCTFVGNNTGVIINDGSLINLKESNWENNITGLYLAGRVEGEVTDNTFTTNAVGLDLLQVTEPNLRFIGNNIYNNKQGLLAPPGNNLVVRENYWGSSSGPYHEKLNFQGHGDTITGDPSFIPWAPYAFYEDDSPPQVSLSLPEEMWYIDEPVPLQISLAEDKWLDSVALAVYGPGGDIVMSENWWQDEWPPSGTSLSWELDENIDGVYYFRVMAIDGKGNQSHADEYLVLDRQPPTVLQIGINNGAEKTSSLTVELSLRAADANGITAMMITNEGGPPGEWEPYLETRSWQLLPGPSGLRKITVRFRDGAGWESEATASIFFNNDSEGNNPPRQDPVEDGQKKENPEPQPEEKTGKENENSVIRDNVPGSGRKEQNKKQSSKVIEFVDVLPGYWAKPIIETLAAEGLLYGDGQGHFFPEAPLTRAELAALLDRILAIPETIEANWRDIPHGSWYASAVSRVTGAGIMEGDGGNFKPLQEVSREQAIISLAKAANWKLLKGMDISSQEQEDPLLISTEFFFLDQNNISYKAQAAVLWAVKEGLIFGYPDGYLRPSASITRAEAAVLVERFRTKLKSYYLQ